MQKGSILKVIQQEIDWTEEDRSMTLDDMEEEDFQYCDGFIAGLKQAKLLISKCPEDESPVDALARELVKQGNATVVKL